MIRPGSLIWIKAVTRCPLGASVLSESAKKFHDACGGTAVLRAGEAITT
jgi:hypothetical protein